MSRLVFDIETNGFLEDMTTIHSLVIKDIDTGEVLSCASHHNSPSMGDCIQVLQEADVLIGHNIIGFDIPAIKKMFPGFNPRAILKDTLIYSRFLWPDIIDIDLAKIKTGRSSLPMAYAGLHKLEAWGYRLGKLKGEYSKEMEKRGLDPWFAWNEEMQRYCEQDVEVTHALWELIEKKKPNQVATDMEHRVAEITRQQEQNGFLFDMKAANVLLADLLGERATQRDALSMLFPPWQVVDKVFTPKVNSTKFGYVKGVETTKYKTIVFNPNSRQQIANRLIEIHGWKPMEFTPTGQAKVDEDILGKLPWPEAKQLSDYMMLQKRIGQLAEGDEALMKHVKEDGRIHGGVNPCGTPTARATHSRPNMSQLPKNGKPYGKQFRALMKVPHGKKLVGTDVSGLELRMLAHYMAKWDNGTYAKVVCEGDVHTVNQQAAGLPSRNAAKTFIYAFLYGAGDANLGGQLGGTAKDGKRIRAQFLKGVPALKALIDMVKSTAANNDGYIIALDGRKLKTRSQHSALNTLLQAAGAIVCKQWMIHLHETIAERGLQGRVKQVGWFHDELQLEVDEELADEVGRMSVAAIEKTQKTLGVNVPLTGEYKIGNNWSETH